MFAKCLTLSGSNYVSKNLFTKFVPFLVRRFIEMLCEICQCPLQRLSMCVAVVLVVKTARDNLKKRSVLAKAF